MITFLRWARAVCMLGLCLWLCVPGPAIGQWYSGGTLHDATGAAWQQADARNRLATAADLVAAAAKGSDGTLPDRTGDDFRVYAELLSACITQASATKAAATLPVKDLAELCVISMNWHGK
jgi:hypothetical protein